MQLAKGTIVVTMLVFAMMDFVEMVHTVNQHAIVRKMRIFDVFHNIYRLQESST